jgi:hypothetical protein
MAMTQEDGFIEVKTTLWNRTPLLKWFRPVVVKRLKLLFDVYSMMIVSRHSDLDFRQVDKMDAEENLTWMVYGGYMSYHSTRNHRPDITVLDAERWVKGMLVDERLKVLETMKRSKEIGELAESYQKARNPEGRSDGSKKDVSEQPS